MRPPLHLATAALFASLAPVPAGAQGRPADADTREVLAYTLTMPKLRQLNQVLEDLYRQQEADPAYQRLLAKKRELAALNEKDELTDAEQERMARLEEEIAEAEDAEDDAENVDQSLSAMAARMAADPRVAGALKRAGLEAREAVTIQLALFQAALTAGLLESGTVKEIPKEVNAENVKFFQANKAAIAALKALGEREEP
ncbi:MAG TPA: hypothetical protein VGA02_13245 [Gemmatimonadales bacterium]|jgi:hypothetical protein